MLCNAIDARRRPTSTSAASTRPRPRCWTRPSRRRTRAASSAPRCRARPARSTSTCTAAPAPTSAARRRRCCRRSTATAASRPRSRRSRPSSGAWKKPDAAQQRRDASRRCRTSSRWARERYAAIAHRADHGHARLISLSGHVQRPGNYELPVTATFRDLIEGCGGGVAGGRAMKCFIPGGSSAPILMPDDLDVQIAVETVAAAGSMAGSGARDRHRRPHQHGAPRPARGRLLPPRVVRQVHAVPRGHALDGRAAEARRVRRGASCTRSTCWSRCATASRASACARSATPARCRCART